MTVLELRGILSRGEFTLLRAHEHVDDRRLRRIQQRERAGLVARVTDEAGRPFAHGTVGLVGPGQLVRLLVPLSDVPSTVELVDDGLVCWRGAVSVHPPRLDAEATVEDGGVRVRWRVEEPLPVDVYAVTVDGSRRRMLRRNVEATEVWVPADELPGGEFAIGVRASAGLREAFVRTDPIRVADELATVHIGLERVRVPVGQPVTAYATVVDAWGRELPGEHVSWSLDGTPAGTGRVVVLAAEPGQHEVAAHHPAAGPAAAALEVDE